MDSHHRTRTLMEKGGELRRGRTVRRQQIGEHAALEQLAGEICFRGVVLEGYADGDRGSLANLVFQNAQGFVERGDEEVHDAVADGLLAGGGLCRDGQRGGAGDVGRHQQRAGLGVERAGVEQFPAQAGFRIRAVAAARMRPA
jgi:hypothetical protein